MTLFRLAFRNIFRHRARSLITLSAIVFGTASLIFVGGYFEDTFHKMSESYIKGHTGHLQISKKGFFEEGRRTPFKFLVEDAQWLADQLRSLSGVEAVNARLQFNALVTAGDQTVPCVVQGVEPSPLLSHKRNIKDKYEVSTLLDDLGSVIIDGEPLDEADPFGLTMGIGLADGLGTRPGDAVVLLANTLHGALNAVDLEMKGVFQTSAKAFDDKFVRLPIRTAQSLVDTNGVQSLVVLLNQTAETENFKRRIVRFLEENRLDLEVKTWRELNDFFTRTETLFRRIFFILKTVISLIVILSIYNTMNMSVMERITEIGTLMAIGTKKKMILTMILLEGLILGAMGGLLGVLFGVGFTAMVGAVGIPMPPPAGAAMYWISQPKIVLSSIQFAFVLAVCTSVLSSVLPGWQASRREIAAALRHVN